MQFERPGTLSARAREIKGDGVALDVDLDLHGNLLVGEPIAVDQVLRRVDAIGQRCDGSAADLLTLSHEVREAPADRLSAVLAAHLLDALIGDADGGNLGIEIAERPIFGSLTFAAIKSNRSSCRSPSR